MREVDFVVKILRNARLNKGITHSQLSSSLHTHATTISKLEKGVYHLRLTMFFRICEILGLEPSEVIKEARFEYGFYKAQLNSQLKEQERQQ